MERLSPDDAHILALESPAIAGHTLKVLVLEPAAEPLDLERLRASVDARLPEGSRGRDRVELGPGGATDAHWVADDQFDVAAHVRRREGTAGVDEDGAWAAASEIMSERLDHARPLWAIDLVGPLDDGREADRRPHPSRDGRRDHLRALPLRGAVGRARRRAAQGEGPRPLAAPAAAEHQSRLGELGAAAGRGRRASSVTARAAPRSPSGSARAGELAFTAVPLAELRAIGKTRPGHVTVNDVFLAGVAGGLRDWLASGARRLPRLRAQIPVSLHHRGESATELGNRDSFFNVDLPSA